MLKTIFLALLALIIPTVAGHAMDFTTIGTLRGATLIKLSGDIKDGDAAAFVTYLDRFPQKTGIGFYLDSPGGLIVEAEKIAHLVNLGRYPVVVDDDAVCASACFLLFAASPRRYATASARIGVHSVSSPLGAEDIVALALTTLTARAASYYGVPPDILGRLVSTKPDDVAWLTRAEELEMGVEFLDDAPPAPVPPVRPLASTSRLFQQGVADRYSWNNWFTRLTGDYQKGAVYWTTQYRLPTPGPCEAVAAPHDDGQFSAGCQEAKIRAAPYVRLGQQSLYSTGWNSLDHP